MGKRKHDWITKFLEYQENSEPPKLYKEWVGMSTIAAVLQRKCRLPWGNLTFYPNLYVVLVGPSGKCRKGTAMNVGKSFLRELGIELTAEAITREALIKDIAESSNSEITIEGKAMIHCSLTIFSPELAVFLGYENKQLMSDLTDWYDCADRWTYRTKGQGVDEIIGMWVNLLGATTPELIQAQFPQDAIGGGLSSRIIFVYEDQKSKSVATPFLEDRHLDLERWLIGQLDDMSMLKGDYTWNEEFLEKWVEWYHYQDNHPAIKDERFRGYIHRRPNHILKMCMILSASERDDMVITGKIFDRALDLLKRTERKMPKTFSGHGRARFSGVLSEILTYVSDKGKVSRQDIMEHFFYDIEGDRHLDSMISMLKGTGYVKIRTDGQSTMIEWIADNGV